MTTRAQLLALLETHQGEFLSGEEIARRLSVSRAAVWKAVKALRQEGYPIGAVTNRGYCLSQGSDILSPQGIRKFLSPACQRLELTVLPTVSSTNAWLREQAAQGAPEGSAVIAGGQTAGRGRFGRSFFSPEETGVYLSVLLRPSCAPLPQVTRLTALAAVALCQAIEAVSGRSPEIKWVNDIFLDGKKVCGILSEASFSMETGTVDYAVLGVGMNVYPPAQGFPPELEQTAGWILDTPLPDGKNRLAGEFLNRFWALWTEALPADAIREYRRRNLVIGKSLTVTLGNEARAAYALDIDEECRMVVRFEDESIQALSYGEVQIRL